MCGEMEHGFHLHMEHQAIHGGEFKEGICTSIPNPPIPSTSRPNSMVIKVCRREFIPPHIVAEAISTLRGLDLRWSGPITPGERRYVEQYVLAKYPHQYFRRKCKHAPKGLFAYPVVVSGAGGEAAAARYSLHWVSEAHRNGWHVLLDATGLAAGDRLPLSLHRPDFVTCALDDARAQPPSAATATVTCLLVRRRSFDVTSKGDN
uniref:Uncharacterized protein n=1 Tax=Oryza barthii TaxID=65489 RepID=A0A0D3HLW4_9ORYZ